MQKPTIFTSSDHRLSIIKEIPRTIKKLISILSSSKNILKESAIYYEKCLKNSGYKTKQNILSRNGTIQSNGINNQKETIKTKRKENITLFGSIHHTASLLKPIS